MENFYKNFVYDVHNSQINNKYPIGNFYFTNDLATNVTHFFDKKYISEYKNTYLTEIK